MNVERWERRAKKLAKRRERMQVAGAGLKKVLLPLLLKRAEEAESKAPKLDNPATRHPATKSPRAKRKRKKR